MKITRRKLLWTAGIGGSSLVIGWAVFGSGPQPVAPRTSDGFLPNAFLELTQDNSIYFYCPRDEMGQGVTTGFATLVGEELDVKPTDLRVKLATVHPAYNNPAFRYQGTGGSTSMMAHFLPLRQAAADTRQLLINAASKDLGVAASKLRTDRGHVVLPAGETYPYSEFMETASILPLPEGTELKPRGHWRYIGKEGQRVDGLAKATGTVTYGIDIQIDDLHRAVVRRPPVAGSTLRAWDDTHAKEQSGVVFIAPISTGVVVVAKQYWQAKTAAELLEIEWDEPDLAAVNSRQIRDDYQVALNTDEGSTQTQGDIIDGIEKAQRVVSEEFWTPYLAHAPMEPMNAVVRIQSDRVDVWSGTQSPAGTRGLVARSLKVDAAKVHVHSTLMGGGFGRRGALTHIVEAAEAAAKSGKPVQVIWSREEDIKNGFFRPAALTRIKAGMAGDGQLLAWDAVRVGGNIEPDLVATALPGVLPKLPDGLIDAAVGLSEKAIRDWFVAPSSVEGLYGDYQVPSYRIRNITRNHGLPLGFWRSVGHSQTAFAKESILDIAAHTLNLDPVELRLLNTEHNPRLHHVIRVAGEGMKRWTQITGRGLGIAAHASFDSYVAQVAEVSVEQQEIRVHRVLCVVDCGLAVNPDNVRAQMEGSIIFGLSAALYGDLQIENGRIVESNFHDYAILRMADAPEIEVIIVDSDSPPSGAGEPGVPPIAPAVANAVFAATGERLRELPLKPQV